MSSNVSINELGGALAQSISRQLKPVNDDVGLRARIIERVLANGPIAAEEAIASAAKIIAWINEAP